MVDAHGHDACRRSRYAQPYYLPMAELRSWRLLQLPELNLKLLHRFKMEPRDYPSLRQFGIELRNRLRLVGLRDHWLLRRLTELRWRQCSTVDDVLAALLPTASVYIGYKLEYI